MKKQSNTGNHQGRIFLRVMGYMLKSYKFSFLCVVVCILGTALATLKGTLFMQTLIDDYIVPLLNARTPDFTPLAHALSGMAGVYAMGIICAYGHHRIMVNITQGTMRKIRKDLFTHMEGLPIRYFDTHAHGDVMSVYTNDVDTLRQLISQSIPQIINSSVTLVITFTSMVVLSVPLTVVAVLMVCVMLLAASKIGKNPRFTSGNSKKSWELSTDILKK